MNLREFFIEIASKYALALKEPFTEHPMAQFIRRESKQVFSQIILNEDLAIKGSAGQGGWTTIPWVGFFNKNETDGAREGVYVIYIFSEDLKRIYLTLNQGITKPIENDGRKLAFQKLKSKVIDIRTNHPLAGFNSDDDIDIAKTGDGADYGNVTIFYKEYLLNFLPDEESMIDDLKKILSFYNEYLLESNVLTAGTDFQNEKAKEEGKRKLVKHYVRERNPKIIKEAKKIALEKTGELKCEICNFLFKNRYGNIAKDFIEGHHKKPIAEMQEGEKTMINDIALVCSNCHRVIHMKQPCLSIEEVKQILK